MSAFSIHLHKSDYGRSSQDACECLTPRGSPTDIKISASKARQEEIIWKKKAIKKQTQGESNFLKPLFPFFFPRSSLNTVWQGVVWHCVIMSAAWYWCSGNCSVISYRGSWDTITEPDLHLRHWGGGLKGLGFLLQLPALLLSGTQSAERNDIIRPKVVSFHSAFLCQYHLLSLWGQSFICSY